MRAILHWILILHVLHLPVPFPDLDGECRGAPIHSLSEAHAWHVMILGVCPNEDIDRGPIRTHRDGDRDVPVDSPFGDLVINVVSSNSVGNAATLGLTLAALPNWLSTTASISVHTSAPHNLGNSSDCRSGEVPRSQLGVWLI